VNEIKSNDELKVGEYYHCFDRRSGRHSIHKCEQNNIQGMKCLSRNRIWADDNNNQALEKWLIYGPVEIPNLGTIGLCNKHHGHGFVSDCAICQSKTEN